MAWLIVAGLAIFSAQFALAATNELRTINVGGTTRNYCYVEPDGQLDGTVIFLHGAGGGCAPGNNSISDAWRAKAAGHGFRLVMPLGVEATWNGCSAPPETCSQPRTAAESMEIDDVAFLDALVQLHPGPTRLVGVSNGGTLVYNYLCRGHRVDAAAVVASVNYAEACPDPGGRLLVMHSNSLVWTDPFVPWAGGGSASPPTPPVEPGLEGFDVTIQRYSCQHGWPGHSPWWGWFVGVGCTNEFQAEDVIWDWLQ